MRTVKCYKTKNLDSYYLEMEKLLELLNECTNGRFKSEDDLRLCIEMRWYCRKFIKRLVENNKIDRDVSINWEWHYESLLMKLAIQDNPIEFLISYLK